MNINEFDSVLLLGVGGVSMHQIAKALLEKNKLVFGYDIKANEYIDELVKKGMKFSKKFDKSFLNVDLCIVNGAIPKDNKYLLHLKYLNIKVIDRAEALDMLCREFKCVIAVAGTHGKSTTASIIYEVLRASNKKVSCHIGADVFAPRFKFGDDYLVVEACEYKKSFLALHPTISVITNVEPDHMDCYTNMFNLRSAFLVFLRRGKTRFVIKDNSTSFIKLKGVHFVENCYIEGELKGEYNQKNMSLALAVVKYLGVDENFAIKLMKKYKGVPRRNEHIGVYKNKNIFIDYAHHPTEIEAFTSSFIKTHSNTLFIFQPHTYSRTKFLFSEFMRVLTKIDNLIIYKEYPARETKKDGASALELFNAIKQKNNNTKYCASEKTLTKCINDSTDIQNIVFVGAGDINMVAKRLIVK